MLAKSTATAPGRDPYVFAASFTANLLALAVPLSMIQIYDRVIPNDGVETLTVLALVVVTSVLAEVALRMARRRLLLISGDAFERDAYRRAIRGLLSEDPANDARANQGTSFTRLTAIERLRAHHTGDTATAILDLPFAILFLAVILMISPFVGGVVLAILALSSLILRHIRRGILGSQRDRLEVEARRHSYVVEVLSGMETVKGLRIEDFMARRYERLLTQSAFSSAEIARRIQHAQGFTAAVGTLAPVVTAVAGAYLAIRGEISVGALAALVLLTGRIVQPVLRLESFVASADSARLALRDYLSLAELPHRGTGTTAAEKIDRIALRGVATAPDPGLGIAFEGVELDIARGDFVLLTNVRRAHATHFLRLLLGEVPVTAGEITLDGVPVAEVRLEDRQRLVRLLSGETSLLDGTLLDNLSGFAPGPVRGRAIDLANRLGLDDFIVKSPDGLATQVRAGNNGRIPRSAARIALNVAGLVTAPDVILLDDADAGLDDAMLGRLVAWLRDTAPGRIVVMASGRPELAALANRSVDLSGAIRHVQDGVAGAADAGRDGPAALSEGDPVHPGAPTGKAPGPR